MRNNLRRLRLIDTLCWAHINRLRENPITPNYMFKGFYPTNLLENISRLATNKELIFFFNFFNVQFIFPSLLFSQFFWILNSRMFLCFLWYIMMFFQVVSRTNIFFVKNDNFHTEYTKSFYMQFIMEYNHCRFRVL